jgi:predicted permease
MVLLDELLHAVRNLGRAPRFSIACVFTLALALAGTATLLNLLEAFVFRKLAVAAPEQLVGVYPASNEFSSGFSPSALQALRARQQALTDVCGVTAGYGALNVQIGSGAVRQRPAEAVSGNCYALLGVTASIGRTITTDDEPAAGDPAHVVIISDRLWREEFDASPDVLGQILRLEGTPLTIVGVLPGTYRGLNADEAPGFALPLTLPWALKLHPPRAMHAVGRLRQGIAFGEAAAHLTSIWPEVEQSTGADTTMRQPLHLRVVPLANGFSILRDRYRSLLYALAALAACLLLLACVNIGGLSLARVLDRRAVFAVQLALGAGRKRLAAQLVFEGLLIGAMAALVAIPIASWAAQVAGQSLWTGYRPFTIESTPLVTTLLATAVLGALAALFISAPGLVALSAQSWDLGARSAGHGTRSGRRRALLGTQIALCVVLAFGAALFATHLHALGQLPLGYEPAGLQWVRLDRTSRTGSVPTFGYADTLLARIAALPGVESAAMSTSFGTADLWDVGDGVVMGAEGLVARHVRATTDRISPEFFRTASIPLHQGREFTWNDVSSRASVAILNRSFADRLFPKVASVGRTVSLGGGRSVSIVGVVADATPGDPRLQDVPQLYLPLGSDLPAAPVLLVRLRGGRLTEASLRDSIEPLGRHQMLRASSMNDQVKGFLVQERLMASTSSLFALLAVLVSITGLYAAISQNVIRRTREIGVRIAVGATPAAVRSHVLSEAVWIVAIGVGLGGPAALAGAHAAQSLVSDVSASTTTVLAVTVLGIAGVATLVAAWPAARAAGSDVARALRDE